MGSQQGWLIMLVCRSAPLEPWDGIRRPHGMQQILGLQREGERASPGVRVWRVATSARMLSGRVESQVLGQGSRPAILDGWGHYETNLSAHYPKKSQTIFPGPSKSLFHGTLPGCLVHGDCSSESPNASANKISRATVTKCVLLSVHCPLTTI